MDVERLTTWQGERDGTRPPPPPSPQVLTELREAIADATGVLRTLTFTYLAVWAYVVIAAGSVTHRQLLVGTSIELPLLGASVGLETFFWLAPALFLVLYANVLLQLYLLARRVRRFDAAARRLRPFGRDQEAHSRSLLTPFPFVEWRAGRETAQAMHAVFALTNWALYILLPLFLLLFVQFKFLPYQHDTMTPFHLALVVVALALVWLVWPRLNQGQGEWWKGVKELGRGSISRWMLAASPVLSAACVLAGLLLWFDQRPSALARIEPYVPSPVASFLDYRWSRITVRDAILMRREPAPEIVAQFRREAGAGKEEEGERRAYLDAELAEPVSLTGRNLQRAELTRSKLWRARLGDANLRGANLQWARLQGADLRAAQLQDADLWNAEFQGADLGGAQVQGADLAGSSSRAQTSPGPSSRA